MDSEISDDKKIVGHKSFSDGRGGFYHEPLTKRDAADIWDQCKASEEKRKDDMPTEKDAIGVMFEAYQRLKELGWKEAIYCPKDGTPFDVIEAGSTGVHYCTYSGEWPKGSWWVHAGGDIWPSRPVLFKQRQE